MRKARQRVIFAGKANHGTRIATAPLGNKGRVEPANVPGDLKAGLFHKVGLQLGRFELLKADFGIGPDFVGHFDKVGFVLVESSGEVGNVFHLMIFLFPFFVSHLLSNSRYPNKMGRCFRKDFAAKCGLYSIEL